MKYMISREVYHATKSLVCLGFHTIYIYIVCVFVLFCFVFLNHRFNQVYFQGLLRVLCQIQVLGFRISCFGNKTCQPLEQSADIPKCINTGPAQSKHTSTYTFLGHPINIHCERLWKGWISAEQFMASKQVWSKAASARPWPSTVGPVTNTWHGCYTRQELASETVETVGDGYHWCIECYKPCWPGSLES